MVNQAISCQRKEEIELDSFFPFSRSSQRPFPFSSNFLGLKATRLLLLSFQFLLGHKRKPREKREVEEEDCFKLWNQRRDSSEKSSRESRRWKKCLFRFKLFLSSRVYLGDTCLTLKLRITGFDELIKEGFTFLFPLRSIFGNPAKACKNGPANPKGNPRSLGDSPVHCARLKIPHRKANVVEQHPSGSRVKN